MIDYGLFALLVVILVLVFLAFHAWRGIKADGERIRELASQLETKASAMDRQVQDGKRVAEEALATAKAVEGTHHKVLLRRIDEAEASTLAQTKTVQTLLEKVASLGGRLSAIQRWAKREEAEEEETEEAQELPMFPAAVPAPVTNSVPGHFGRMPGRKVG